MLLGDYSRWSWFWFLVWWASALLGCWKCNQIIWVKWYDKMHIELIVPLPGLYDDKIIYIYIFFFLLEGCHRGTFCIFLHRRLKWCAHMQHVCLDLSSSASQSSAHTHTHTHTHTHVETRIPGNDFKDSGECGPADTPVLTLRSSPLPSPHVPPQPTTSESCFWGL